MHRMAGSAGLRRRWGGADYAAAVVRDPGRAEPAAAPSAAPRVLTARWAGIPAALFLVAIVLVLPLATVFTQALQNGLAAAFAALAEPDALAALRLTPLVAAIAVPVNTFGGLAAAWCTARFRFPGRHLLVTVIEAPLTVSPVISGLVWVLLFGSRGWFGPQLQSTGLQMIFATPGLRPAPISL